MTDQSQNAISRRDVSPSRRSMIGALVGLPVAAIAPASASAAPPVERIYGVIARHRAAYAAYHQACVTDDLEALEPAAALEGLVLDELLSTTPDTAEGCGAVLAYVVAASDSGNSVLRTDDHWRELCETLIPRLRSR
jgi:hypothetical protein